MPQRFQREVRDQRVAGRARRARHLRLGADREQSDGNGDQRAGPHQRTSNPSSRSTAALFAGFIKSEDPEDDGSESPLGALGSLVNRQDKQVNTVASLEPGVLIPLGPGEDITFSEPADLGGSYEAFQYRMLLRAAAGFNVPYSAMTGDLRSVNYSSIRAGLLEFRRRVTATQNFVVVQQFARPFINEWIRIASELGLAPWTFAAYRKNVLLYRRVK